MMPEAVPKCKVGDRVSYSGDPCIVRKREQSIRHPEVFLLELFDEFRRAPFYNIDERLVVPLRTPGIPS